MAKQILYPLVDRGDAFVLPHHMGRHVEAYPEKLGVAGFDAYYRPNSATLLPVTWMPPPRFFGDLGVTGYHKGRSSACYEVLIKMAGEKPIVGLMSCAAFLPLIGLLQNGRVSREWTFVKRGTNYLIEAARD